MDEAERFRRGTHACKPLRYRPGKRKPKHAPSKTVVLGLECALRTPPSPQDSAFQLSGSYESIQDPNGDINNLTLRVNHTGNYIAAWLSRFDDTEVASIVGRTETVPTFSLFEPGNAVDSSSPPVAYLGISADGKGLFLNLDPGISFGVGKLSGEFTFTKLDSRTTLSNRALERLPKSAEARLSRLLEHSPIPHFYRQTITTTLTSDRFDSLLRAFFEEEIRAGSLNNGARLAAEELDDYLEQELKRIRGWRLGPVDLRGALTQFASIILKTRSATVSRSTTIIEQLEDGESSVQQTKSRNEWLTDIAALVSAPSFVPKPSLRWLVSDGKLGLSARPKDLPFAYEFVFEGEGIAGDIGIGVQYFRGTLTVQRIEPGKSEEPMEFMARITGYSGGLSGGIQTAKGLRGVGRSNRVWSEVDFVTTFLLYEGGTQGSVGVGGAVGPTTWVLDPPPGKQPMEVDFTETALHGLSAGFEFGSGGGAISKDGRQFEEIIEEAEKLETTRYEARFGGSTRAHFALGSSLLTAEGRRLLGFLAASELATLSRPGTRLDLIGSADRVDVEWYNQLLSEVRAQNALQYLEDVLGKHLRATTRAVGLGEQPPRDAGMDDGTEAPEYRRVYVEYEGRAIANLQVSRK